jgi:aryl-alcohol dehydrogenase-like predicted oxidoreductase
VAIAWILRNPAVTGVVCGPTSVQQLHQCLAAEDISVADAEYEAISGLMPAPTATDRTEEG